MTYSLESIWLGIQAFIIGDTRKLSGRCLSLRRRTFFETAFLRLLLPIVRWPSSETQGSPEFSRFLKKLGTPIQSVLIQPNKPNLIIRVSFHIHSTSHK